MLFCKPRVFCCKLIFLELKPLFGTETSFGNLTLFMELNPFLPLQPLVTKNRFLVQRKGFSISSKKCVLLQPSGVCCGILFLRPNLPEHSRLQKNTIQVAHPTICQNTLRLPPKHHSGYVHKHHLAAERNHAVAENTFQVTHRKHHPAPEKNTVRLHNNTQPQ